MRDDEDENHESEEVSPFNPGFGGAAGPLVGRTALLRRIENSLHRATNVTTAAGATRRRGVLLLGPRGSGKTAMLVEAADQARAEGMLVIETQALKYGEFSAALTEGIADMLASIDVQKPSKRKAWFHSLEIGFPDVFKWRIQQRAVDQFPQSQNGISMLTGLAERAAAADIGLVISVDEMQNIPPAQLEAFAKRMQALADTRNLPVHFRGAALPYFWHTSLSDPAQSFFRRNEDIPLPPITASQAHNGYKRYVADVGGAFTPEALHLAVSAVNGSSYMFQLVGHHSWCASLAPNKPIEVDDVRQGIDDATFHYEKDVSRLTWGEMSQVEQAIVLETFTNPHVHTRRSLYATMAELGYNAAHAAELVDRLTYDQVLHSDDEVLSISAGSSLLPSFLSQRAEDEAEFAKLSAAQRGAEPRPARGRAGVSECGAWMPRARSYCLLPPGHAGRHRSKGNRR